MVQGFLNVRARIQEEVFSMLSKSYKKWKFMQLSCFFAWRLAYECSVVLNRWPQYITVAWALT